MRPGPALQEPAEALRGGGVLENPVTLGLPDLTPLNRPYPADCASVRKSAVICTERNCYPEMEVLLALTADGSYSRHGLVVSCVGEAVGVRAGFDDGAFEGEPVHDGCAEAWVSEGLRPPGEGFVGCDGHGCFLPFR